jgi:hypothetical protein
MSERFGGRTEQLVVDPQQGAPPRGEVASSTEAHRITTRGPVERLGDRSPPVDDHGFALLVGHGDATDVERLALGTFVGGLGVDPPEHQRLVTHVELGQPLVDLILDDVPLVAVLERPTRAAVVLVPHGRDRGAGPLEAVVGVVDRPLLVDQVGVLGQRRSWGREPGNRRS